ncbi:MAG: hypothetical protein ACK5WZ_15160 [Pseudobdellovibrionaceae bacterium]
MRFSFGILLIIFSFIHAEARSIKDPRTVAKTQVAKRSDVPTYEEFKRLTLNQQKNLIVANQRFFALLVRNGGFPDSAQIDNSIWQLLFDASINEAKAQDRPLGIENLIERRRQLQLAQERLREAEGNLQNAIPTDGNGGDLNESEINRLRSSRDSAEAQVRAAQRELDRADRQLSLERGVADRRIETLRQQAAETTRAAEAAEANLRNIQTDETGQGVQPDPAFLATQREAAETAQRQRVDAQRALQAAERERDAERAVEARIRQTPPSAVAPPARPAAAPQPVQPAAVVPPVTIPQMNFRCIFAGFPVVGATCQAPQMVELKFEGANKKFSCVAGEGHVTPDPIDPTKTQICNPVLFGLKDKKPICIGRPFISATKKCREESATGGESTLAEAVQIVRDNPTEYQKLMQMYELFCKGTNRQEISTHLSTLGERLSQGSANNRNDIAETCLELGAQYRSLQSSRAASGVVRPPAEGTFGRQ